MKSLLTGALVGLVLSCAVVRANEDRPARRSSLSYCVHLLVSQVLPPKRDDAEALARELTAAGLNDYVFPYLSGVIYPRSPWPDTEDAIIWMSGLSTEGLRLLWFDGDYPVSRTRLRQRLADAGYPDYAQSPIVQGILHAYPDTRGLTRSLNPRLLDPLLDRIAHYRERSDASRRLMAQDLRWRYRDQRQKNWELNYRQPALRLTVRDDDVLLPGGGGGAYRIVRGPTEGRVTVTIPTDRIVVPFPEATLDVIAAAARQARENPTDVVGRLYESGLAMVDDVTLAHVMRDKDAKTVAVTLVAETDGKYYVRTEQQLLEELHMDPDSEHGKYLRLSRMREVYVPPYRPEPPTPWLGLGGW